VSELPPKRRLPLPKPYTPAADGHRAVRSFVLRQGRVSNAQARAVEDLLPRYGIPFQAAPLDLAAIFGAGVPVVLEIGFGMGETSAAHRPVAARHRFCRRRGAHARRRQPVADPRPRADRQPAHRPA
jgi:hypothetical protein